MDVIRSWTTEYLSQDGLDIHVECSPDGVISVFHNDAEVRQYHDITPDQREDFVLALLRGNEEVERDRERARDMKAAHRLGEVCAHPDALIMRRGDRG